MQYVHKSHVMTQMTSTMQTGLTRLCFFPQNAQLEKQYQELLREFDSKDGDHMMEVTQLREEISKLRAEMEGILSELQTIMDVKLSLELEIAAYRKLLEGEENRSVKNPPSRRDDTSKHEDDKKDKEKKEHKEIKENKEKAKHDASDSSKESK